MLLKRNLMQPRLAHSFSSYLLSLQSAGIVGMLTRTSCMPEKHDTKI